MERTRSSHDRGCHFTVCITHGLRTRTNLAARCSIRLDTRSCRFCWWAHASWATIRGVGFRPLLSIIGAVLGGRFIRLFAKAAFRVCMLVSVAINEDLSISNHSKSLPSLSKSSYQILPIAFCFAIVLASNAPKPNGKHQVLCSNRGV